MALPSGAPAATLTAVNAVPAVRPLATFSACSGWSPTSASSGTAHSRACSIAAAPAPDTNRSLAATTSLNAASLACQPGRPAHGSDTP